MSGRDPLKTIDIIEDYAAMMITCIEDEFAVIPEPTYPHDVDVPTGSISTLIRINTDKYRIANNTHAVRKNLSLPAWLATMAHNRGLNYSQVLQEALRQILI